MTRAAALAVLSALLIASASRAETVLTASTNGLDLAQCFELAKKQSESLQVSVEQINQLEQQYRQIVAATMPNLALNGSQFWQEPGGGGGATFSATSKPQVNFTLNQPIFSGFREYATMRSYRHQGKAAELQLKFANQALFQNVATAFYQVLNLEKSLADTKDLLAMTEDRAKELRSREQLGKSRVSEVLTVESQLASVRSQIEGLKGQVAASRELLSFLIGQDASKLVLDDKLGELPAIESQDAAVARAQGRSDVRASRETEAALREQIKSAWGAFWPTVSFTGNYYLKRLPVLEPIRWDAALNGSLPIFSGGGQLAAVRLAESQWRAADDNARLVARQAASQIRTDYTNLQAALSQFRTLREAFEKARDSYRLQLREYRLGIVDNLTVLQAMNAVQSAQLSLDQTGYQIKLDYLQLKVATEEMP